MSMNFGMGYNPLLNPNITPQQRVMQYEHQMQLQNQMQPPMQMQSQMPMQMQTQALIKPFYVTSRQEAEASQTPFDGSLHIYLNTANNEIYTKKLLNDGSAEFKIYKSSIKADNIEKISQEKAENFSKLNLEPLINRLDEHDKSLTEIKSEIERMNKYPINKSKKEVKADE